MRRKRSLASVWTLRALVVGVVLLPFGIRGANFIGLPDPRLPPGYLAWRDQTVADDANAAFLYRVAADAIGERRVPLGIPGDWFQASAYDKALLAETSRPMVLWREGTRLPNALPSRERKELRPLSESETSLFVRLACLEGLRQENRTNFEEAFDWYVATLKFADHVQSRVGFNGRFRGDAVHQTAANFIKPWADQPNLSTDTLRRALREVQEAHRPIGIPGSAVFAELERIEGLLDEPDSLDEALGLDAHNRQGERLDGWPARLSHLSRAFQSEPERSRRFVRLVAADWVEGLELRGRSSSVELIHRGSLTLFSKTGRVDARALARRLDSTRYARIFLPNLSIYLTALDAGARNQADLELHLAERLFRREKGHPPESPEELSEYRRIQAANSP